MSTIALDSGARSRVQPKGQSDYGLAKQPTSEVQGAISDTLAQAIVRIGLSAVHAAAEAMPGPGESLSKDRSRRPAPAIGA